MIMMTNGDDRRFVFDSAVNYYKSLGYVPETDEPADAIVVNDVPVEPEEEAVTEPEVAEAPEEVPETDEPVEAEPVDFEPNDAGRYECPYCDKDYSTKANLLKHIKQAHPEVQ